MINTPAPEVFCFGEVLWDVFAGGKKPGGAPMNVAYHLSKAGIPTAMITRIGSDSEGKELEELLRSWKTDLSYLTKDPEHRTGSVIATIDENNDAHYEILENVAWDYITVPADSDALRTSRAFVFGTLACRNCVSKETLFKLLELAPYKVFDVNLRPPFYSLALIEELLSAADLVKMNEAELRQILPITGGVYTTEEQSVLTLMDFFSLKEVIITRGAKGASYYRGDQYFSSPVIPVIVKDTVGSGDSFLAGFLAEKLAGAKPEECLIHGITLSAFVTQQEGACPPYTREELKLFKAGKV